MAFLPVLLLLLVLVGALLCRLAQRIVQGDVPEALINRRVRERERERVRRWRQWGIVLAAALRFKSFAAQQPEMMPCQCKCKCPS